MLNIVIRPKLNYFVSSEPGRLVSVLAMGEGFHNYHHTFPYDYGTSEWGLRLNVTTRFINAMAKLGFAYDLRTASPSVVAARAARTGHPELTRYSKVNFTQVSAFYTLSICQARDGSKESKLGGVWINVDPIDLIDFINVIAFQKFHWFS